MRRFDFIGFMENYTEDLRRLSRVLSIPLVESKENFNKYPDYQETMQQIKSDSQLMSKLRDCLSEDLAFYEDLKASVIERVAA